MMSGLGGMLAGGLDSITGVMGDLLNNFFADMGLTDKANDALTFFGMDRSFGAKRDLGSGQGISSMLPGGSWQGLGSSLGLGGNQQQQSGSSTPLTTSPGGLTAAQKAFAETVSYAEGTAGSAGYNTWFGGSEYAGDLSQYTINEVVALQHRFLAEGHGRFDGGRQKSAAVGKYQMTHPETYAAKAGLDPAVDKFTPENQDKIFLYGYVMTQGGVTEAEINAPEISAQTIDKLAPVFASFPNLFGTGKGGIAGGDGVSYYGGQGAKTKSQIQERYRQNRSRISAPPPAPAQPAPAPQGSTKTTAPKRNERASTMIMPGSVNVAAAPQRSRPGGSSQSSGGSGGSTPDITFHPSTFYDPATLSTLVAVG
jgi:muramidase (phage lysozyme)